MRTWVLTLALCFAAAEVAMLATPQTAEAQRRGRRRRPSPPPPPPQAPAPAAPEAGGFRGPARIDFDDRLVQGQTNKSGAVVLFSRKATNISSMVKRRKSFRHLTVRTIYDR